MVRGATARTSLVGSRRVGLGTVQEADSFAGVDGGSIGSFFKFIKFIER